MATRTFYRLATVSSAKAMESLSKRFSEENILSFERKVATADEAVAAGATEGDLIFAATVRVAEFPPSDGEEGSDSNSGSSDSEAPKGDSSSDDGDPSSKSDSDDSDDSSDSGDAAPAFGDQGDGAGAEPKKLKPEEEMVHLLHQILDALKGGGAPGGPDLGPGAPGGPGDLDLPDVGAPAAGDPMAAPGGPATKAPLPPPVKQKSPIGAGAFSHHIAGRKSFTFVRQDVKADGLGHRALIQEAMELAPGYRVAKLNVDAAEDSATLTMELL